METSSSTEGQPRTAAESPSLALGLRRLFLLHAIVQVALGVPLLIVPETWASLVGWGEPFDPVMGRIAGGMFLGLAVGQALAFRAETWREVRLLFVTVLTEVTLLLAVLFYKALSGAAVTDLGFVALSGAFFLAFLYYAQNLRPEAGEPRQVL